MTKNKLLITVASWEDRFLEGTKKLLEEESFKKVLTLYFCERKDWTIDNRKATEICCSNKSIMHQSIEATFSDQIALWGKLQLIVNDIDPASMDVTVDISTMPRETLWLLLTVLKSRGISTSYVYHSPSTYHKVWQSRDPGRPRLVYKLSGIATLGQPTCLVITTGFDPERTRQLMWSFEPRKILLGFQTGSQYENDEKNRERHRKDLLEEYREFDIIEFETDAYCKDNGKSVLSQQVSAWKETHNIVLTSLGPKLGALAAFETHVEHPSLSMVYAPANDWNRNYSQGLGETYSGVCNW